MKRLIYKTGKILALDDKGYTNVIIGKSACGSMTPVVSRRFVDCVNAMAGVEEPEKFVEKVLDQLISIQHYSGQEEIKARALDAISHFPRKGILEEDKS